MSSKVRIQTYLKRNKVSELFQEMMAKLINDLPTEPIEYLVNLLQKKHANIPKSPRTKSALVKQTSAKTLSSSANMWSDNKMSKPSSPSKLNATVNLTEMDGQRESGREYSKPWLSNSKKHSPLKENKAALSMSLPVATKSDWDRRTKMSSTDFDSLRKQDEQQTAPSYGDNDVDLRLVYAKPKVYGNAHDTSGDLAELECKNESGDVSKKIFKKKSTSVSEAKRIRRQKMREAIQEKSDKRKIGEDQDDNDEDDTLELFEDVNDLSNEGVKNPPKTGVYTSGNVNHRKEEIELVLNMSKFFDSLGGAVSVSNYDDKAKSQILDNDDFESASQVTGPRHPVWETPESEVDSAVSNKPSPSRRVNAAMFDIRPSTPKNKSVESQQRIRSPKPGGSATYRTGKSRSGSQLSGMNSRNGEDVKSRDVGRPQSGSVTRKSLSSRTSSKDVQERPKTAQ